MAHYFRRRDFLKATSGMAVMFAYAQDHGSPELTAADVKISAAGYTPRPDYPIQPKRHSEVVLHDTFWRSKVATNARITIPFELQKVTQSGSGRGLGAGVWEAAILSLETHPDAALQAQVDAFVERNKRSPARGNSGFEIAATYYAATGKRDLLDIAIQSADALYKDFKLRSPPFSGGERDAINCVQLYRATHDQKHLDLAKHYLDIRGLKDSVNRSRHNQSYKPVLQQSEAVGHAVNCVSLMVSLTDVGVLTGIKDYFEAASRMWQDAAGRKMYITGGVGSTGNEGFGEPYFLPNISAYSETCAVLLFITLNHRMFLATGESKYIDVMERGMYNNAIDGVSLSGNRFFYVNRLASAGDGRDARWARASLECCPPNLVRFLASMPGFIYAQTGRTIYVNLYVSSETTFRVDDREIALSVDSEMPWGGVSRIKVSAKEPVRAAIHLRVPGWARNRPDPEGLYSYSRNPSGNTDVLVNGSMADADVQNTGYIVLDRSWKSGDVIDIRFPFVTRRVLADAKVRDDRGRVAIERGPIVYCCEWPDNQGSVLDYLLDANAELSVRKDQKFDGGVTVIGAAAKSITNPSSPEHKVTLIPYYLWANRGVGEMTLWLPSREYEVGDTGPAGGLIFYKNPNYAADGWRYLEAAPFDQSSGAKWGCFRRSIAGARGTAIGAGKQNTKDMLAACAEPDTAARVCADLKVNGVTGWFLPSRDELALVYRNLKAAGIGSFPENGALDNVNYWTSSQESADMAAHIDFADSGRQHSDDKDFPRRIRAIRAF